MLSIRKCVRCGRTYDAISGDEKTICPLCAEDLSECEEITEDNVYLKDFRSFSDEPIPENALRTDLKKKRKRAEIGDQSLDELSQDFFESLTSQIRTTSASAFDEFEAELLKVDISQFKDAYPIFPLETQGLPPQNERQEKKNSLQVPKIKVNKRIHNPYLDL